MTIEELKNKDDYFFECYMTKEEYNVELENGDVWDEWGCAEISLGDIGAEYNFCIDKSTSEIENASAIYPTYINKDGYLATNTDNYVHYEIDFDNEHWKEEFENAMCKALIEFFEL